MTNDELDAIKLRNECHRTSHAMTRWENGHRRELYRHDSEQMVVDVDALLAEVERLRAACEAALRYDDSICGCAARGEVSLREAGGGVATGNDLDALYADWIGKARDALKREDT